MALKDATTSNHPDTMKCLVGETISGVFKDKEGNWWLVVKSGHALVLSKAAFWPEQPDNVKRAVKGRQEELGRWMKESAELMEISQLDIA